MVTTWACKNNLQILGFHSTLHDQHGSTENEQRVMIGYCGKSLSERPMKMECILFILISLDIVAKKKPNSKRRFCASLHPAMTDIFVNVFRHFHHCIDLMARQ